MASNEIELLQAAQEAEAPGENGNVSANNISNSLARAKKAKGKRKVKKAKKLASDGKVLVGSQMD